jgi:hypothetical protein
MLLGAEELLCKASASHRKDRNISQSVGKTGLIFPVKVCRLENLAEIYYIVLP